LDAILINSIWALANFVTLVAAVCVAYERPQRRNAPSVRRSYSCTVMRGSKTLASPTQDLSESGGRIAIEGEAQIPVRVDLLISGSLGGDVLNKGRLVRQQSNGDGIEAAFEFVDVDPDQYQRIVQLMFSSDQSWLGQDYPKDRVLRSLW